LRGVQADIGKVGIAALQQGEDALDRKLGVERHRLLARLGMDLKDPAAGVDLPRLRQLHGHHAGIAPDDAATAYRRVEYRVSTPHHAHAPLIARFLTPAAIITPPQFGAPGILPRR
jgi:hypothetical protein